MFRYVDDSMTAQMTRIYWKILNKFELFPLEKLPYFFKMYIIY